MARVSSEVDVEEVLRRALLAVEEQRGEVLRHAAHAEALTDELRRQVGAVSVEGAAALETRIGAQAAGYLEAFREADAVDASRLQLGDPADKYGVSNDGGPPCAELIPICHGRCCQFDFALSSQDLDEGVIAWDRERPYLIKHGADGHCVHADPSTHFCTVYEHRPGICRSYDCREDPRIWADYAARLPAAPEVPDLPEWSTTLNLMDRLRRRDVALAAERTALAPASAPADVDVDVDVDGDRDPARL